MDALLGSQALSFLSFFSPTRMPPSTTAPPNTNSEASETTSLQPGTYTPSLLSLPRCLSPSRSPPLAHSHRRRRQEAHNPQSAGRSSPRGREPQSHTGGLWPLPMGRGTAPVQYGPSRAEAGRSALAQRPSKHFGSRPFFTAHAPPHTAPHTHRRTRTRARAHTHIQQHNSAGGRTCTQSVCGLRRSWRRS